MNIIRRILVALSVLLIVNISFNNATFGRESLPIVAVSQVDFDAFVDKCDFAKFLSVKWPFSVRGAHLNGVRPFVFEVFGSGEGTDAMFVFDISLPEFKKTFPRLIKAEVSYF